MPELLYARNAQLDKKVSISCHDVDVQIQAEIRASWQYDKRSVSDSTFSDRHWFITTRNICNGGGTARNTAVPPP